MKKFKGEKIKTKLENSLYKEEHLLQYFKNKEDAKYYSRGSDRYIDCKCPSCGFEKKMRAHNLYNNGFSCKYCKDTMSYPERFMYSYLTIKNIQFNYQYKLNNLNRYFDFYLPVENIAIETHGEQHYKENVTSNWRNSYKNTISSDEIKRNYCSINDIILIEINCSKSSFQYIKRQINESSLPSISYQEEYLIRKKIIENSSKLTVEVVKDIKKGITVNKIAKKHSIDNGTVYNIAKKLSIDEKYIKDGRVKKVYCYETGKIYKSTSKAEDDIGIRKGNVYRVANGSRNYCTGLNGNKYTFKYIQ